MSNTFKILANSLFGVMMTRCEKFKDFKIVTKESQVDKQIKKPNFSCRNIINENLTILEMEKTSVTYNYPIFNRSKTSIKYSNLSEFQRKNLKENYKSSEKLITHLGYDKNCYISFEMYEMMISLGYKINVKKILEYKHSNFMKPYIDFLFEIKSYYKKSVILECQILLRY